MAKSETAVIDGEVVSDDTPKTRAVAKADRAHLPAKSEPMNLIAMAVQKGAGLEVIKELVTLQERLDVTAARKAFDYALSQARAEIPVIIKNRRVKYDAKRSDGKVDYAHEDLAQIADQIDPVLSKFGLSYRFRNNQPSAGQLAVTCIISHELGHSEENTLIAGVDVGAGKNHLQAIGSAATYLSRYALKAALGLAAAETEDDDGRKGGMSKSNPPVPSSSSGSTAGPGTSAAKTAPYKIPTENESFASWAQKYVAAIKTCDTVQEIEAWDKVNSVALDQTFEKAKPTYGEIDRAVAIHKGHLTKPARTGDDPISTGRPPAGEQKSASTTQGAPSIDTEYEDFLKWCLDQIQAQTDPDVLETFFQAMVESNRDAGIFPSDYDKLLAQYQARDKALTTQ